MQGPLAGLKILDFSTLLPGPFATMLLADLGADVLHIEAPNKADVVKELSPQLDSGVSASYAYLHRGKNTRTLDLKTVEGLREVEDLLLEYDIVVEQFRPGVMAIMRSSVYLQQSLNAGQQVRDSKSILVCSMRRCHCTHYLVRCSSQLIKRSSQKRRR